MCERKIDPKQIGVFSKVDVGEWKKIIEKCIITNGKYLIKIFSMTYKSNIVHLMIPF